MIGRNHVGNIHLRCFFARITGYSFSGSVKRSEIALEIVCIDDVVCVFEEFAIALFTFSQRLACLLLFCNIPEYSKHR